MNLNAAAPAFVPHFGISTFTSTPAKRTDADARTALLRRFPCLYPYETIDALPSCKVSSWLELEQKLDIAAEKVAKAFMKKDHGDKPDEDYEYCMFRCHEKYTAHGYASAAAMLASNAPEARFIREYQTHESVRRKERLVGCVERFGDPLVDLLLRGTFDGQATSVWLSLTPRERFCVHNVLDVTEELDLGISTPLTKVAAVTIDRHFARARKADMKLCVGHVFKKYGI